jgi:hypothetical protein
MGVGNEYPARYISAGMKNSIFLYHKDLFSYFGLS